MFKGKDSEEKILKGLSKEQIDEIKDDYYSYINLLIDEFKKYNKRLEYIRIDRFNHHYSLVSPPFSKEVK